MRASQAPAHGRLRGRPKRFGRRRICRRDRQGGRPQSGERQRVLLIWLRCTSPQVRGLNGRSPAIEACELAPSQNCLRGLSIAQWVIFVERRWVNGDERQGFADSPPDLSAAGHPGDRHSGTCGRAGTGSGCSEDLGAGQDGGNAHNGQPSCSRARQFARRTAKSTPITAWWRTKVSPVGWCSGTCCTSGRSIPHSSWRGVNPIEVLDEERPHAQRTIALFPEDRYEAVVNEEDVVWLRLWQLGLERPRQWGGCWMAIELWRQLRLDAFWAARLPPSRKGTCWDEVPLILVVYRLLSPGSEWRLHREWYGRSALPDPLNTDRYPQDACDTTSRPVDDLEGASYPDPERKSCGTRRTVALPERSRVKKSRRFMQGFGKLVLRTGHVSFLSSGSQQKG